MANRIPFLLSSLVVCASLEAGARVQLGTPGSLMDRLQAENVRAASRFTLPAGSAEQIQIQVQDYHFQAGYLSLVGAVNGLDGSDFILKGDRGSLYGWAVLRDRKTAFEYTTDADGALVVEQVPVGKIFPDCDPPEAEAGAGPAVAGPVPAAAPGPEPHIGPYPGTSLLKLQSLPGAPKVLWMNINRIMNGETPVGWTKTQMWEIWQGFAAGFSMFNVNVTTDSAVYAAAGVKNSGKANMFDPTGTSSCGVNAFGTTRGCTIYRKSSTKYNGGTLIHEVGHLLGLSHDGSPSGAYFSGFSTYQWLPIMGAHPSALRWTNSLWQWSKGEYSLANQKQDDLSLMNRHLEYRQDDITGVVPLKLTGTKVTPDLNRGQIARNTDVDTFSFQVASGGGTVRLKIDRIEFIGGSMLDIDATLLDAAGKQVARHNAPAARFAQFDQNLPAGAYRLVIQGGAEGSPTNGFSNYSSLGFYAIDGEIVGGVVGVADRSGPAGSIRISMSGQAGSGARLMLDIPSGMRVRGVALLSARGEKVFEARGRVGSIDLSALPKGQYLLRIAADGATVVRRIARL